MSSTTSRSLPSSYVPQRQWRCPEGILAALRAWIDVDVVWDVDAGCWVVLEACEAPGRWATVNGTLCEGFRRAAEYRDPDTHEPYFLNELIVPWLRNKDIENFGGSADDMYRAQFTLQEELREAAVENGWSNAGEKSYDRTATMARGLSSGKRGRHFGGFRKG